MKERENLQETAGVLFKLLGRLVDLRPDISVLQARCFLLIAEKPGISQRAVLAALEREDSVVSRTLAILSHHGDRSAPGLGLIEIEIDPDDRRMRTFNLTAKGRRIMLDVMGDLKNLPPL